MTSPLLELNHVSRTFMVKKQQIKAVDDISFSLGTGEVLCLVGESGCGKTTTGKIIAGLLSPSAGKIFYKGNDISTLNKAQHNAYRLGVQMIHQDPYASLNPTQTIFDILATPLRYHKLVKTDKECLNRVLSLLELVDLTPPDDYIEKYPHQLSGGQRQRVSIARSLTVNPSFLVADEAVSMVDVSIRISLLRTLSHLKDELGLSVLFITHDLALAKYFAWDGRIGVMYLGRIVELSPAPYLVEHPQHPYTQVLLSAIPEADPDITRKKQSLQLRSMDVPSLLRLPTGCAFHPRCPRFAGQVCQEQLPQLTSYYDSSAVSCHLVLEDRKKDIIAS